MQHFEKIYILCFLILQLNQTAQHIAGGIHDQFIQNAWKICRGFRACQVYCQGGAY
jgi:hypothetical protein